jgi:hypothetical protein
VPKEAKIYEKIVSLYVDAGHSLIDIANILNAEGLPPASNKWKKSARSKRWQTGAIRNILINEAYKGFNWYNRFVYKTDPRTGRSRQTKIIKPRSEWIKVEYPVLISEDRWQAIQLRRQQQKVKPKKPFIGYEDHFLATGLLTCGECGGKLRRQINEKKSKHFYYVCSYSYMGEKALKLHNRERCDSKYWEANKVDDRVFGEVVKILSSPGHYAKAWLKDQNVEELKEKIARLKDKMKMYATAVERNLLMFSHYDDEDLVKIHQKQLKADQESFRATKAELKKVEYELNFKSEKIDRLKAFEKAVSSSNLRKRGSAQVAARKAFSEFLWNLPFKEKRRVLEAVVQPETGGKITVRNVMRSDIVDVPVKNEKPVNDKEPIIELDFTIDINRLEQLINGLNFNESSRQSSRHHLLF